MSTERYHGQARLHTTTISPFITPSLMRLVKRVYGERALEALKKDKFDSATAFNSIFAFPQEQYLYDLYCNEVEVLREKFIFEDQEQAQYAATLDPQSQFRPSDSDITYQRRITKYLYEKFKNDYIKALGDANSAINDVIDSLGLPESKIGLKQEVESTSETMLHNMEKIHSDKWQDEVRFGMLRQHLLTLLALELHESKKRDKIKTLGSDFVDWLDTEIFSTSGEPLGSGENVDVFSLHDRNNLWNSGEVQLHEKFDRYSLTEKIQKKETISVRKCFLDGEEYLIHFHQRTKGDGASINKAVKKALQRQKKQKAKGIPGVFDDIRQEDINDRAGVKLVVVQGYKDKFVASLESRLRTSFGSVVDDSKTNVTPSGESEGGKQSERHTFTRKKLEEYFDFEVVIYSLTEHLNSIYDINVGNGASHELYALERYKKLAYLYFPKEIFPNLDIEACYARKLSEIEEKLKQKNRL